VVRTPPPPRTDAEAAVLEGTVMRVTFENDDTGFRVLRVRPDGAQGATKTLIEPDGMVTIVGRFPAVTRGEHVRAVGKIERDPRHGAQLRADIVTSTLPTTPAGIERYLAGGVVKGIAKKTAQKIVQRFGTTTIHVLDHEPHRLREVQGLGARAEVLAKAWKEQRAVRELMVFLSALGVSPALAQRIHKRYRDDALSVVKGSPYRLALEIWGVGFKSADAIARAVGIAPDDPHRAGAGVLHVLQALAEEGHTTTPRAMVAERTARLLDAGNEGDARPEDVVDAATVARVESAIDMMMREGHVVDTHPTSGSAGREGIAHAPLAAHEAGLAAAILRLLAGDAKARATPTVLPGAQAAMTQFEKATGITLAPAQRAAIELVARAPFAVVTGGPGVGKTTVVRAILSLLEMARLKTVLAAPTGRAAKRMAEATRKEATTIHRLLEVDPRKQKFTRDADRPLEIAALVVDETSMVDVPLAHALLSAVPTGARVVLVGDVDQLPSIGAGAVLRDVIDSGVVPTVRLTEVFRQASASRIIEGAHAILRGDDPRPSGALGGGGPTHAAGELFLVERNDPEEAARTIGDIVETRIPRAFGMDARKDVQVLVPMVRGSVGTRALNADLQARLNPLPTGGLEVRRGQTLFRVGDRVMQTRNDYDRDVFNGDVGFVSAIPTATAEPEEPALGDKEKTTEPRLIVRLEEGREVIYGDEHLDELVLAYACTVHKSQGSEYPAVVIGLVNQHYVMLARKLLYTAVTRAKKLAVIVGSRWALREAVRDARGEDRRTTLAARLRAARS
jgi:exodeoxyribonuclease V alpha subunit